ncbi:MAG TPA: RpiB/LacA/LacB family sugar-phosphate isomerase [Balneolaceae bacterium]|nr:RpiB/LacA/LacB family sugar-phosphate isomerase [Balneolaceae bacterium]
MPEIGIAADHGGFLLKEELKDSLQKLGYELTDFGAFELDQEDDYPESILPLARALSEGKVKKGIAVCGSGVGAAIVANKLPGVRAALITESYSARQGVEHDDMNMLCIGGRVIGSALALVIVQAFLKARYIGSGRYQRRLDQLIQIEKRYLK